MIEVCIVNAYPKNLNFDSRALFIFFGWGGEYFKYRTDQPKILNSYKLFSFFSFLGCFFFFFHLFSKICINKWKPNFFSFSFIIFNQSIDEREYLFNIIWTKKDGYGKKNSIIKQCLSSLTSNERISEYRGIDNIIETRKRIKNRRIELLNYLLNHHRRFQHPFNILFMMNTTTPLLTDIYIHIYIYMVRVIQISINVYCNLGFSIELLVQDDNRKTFSVFFYSFLFSMM